MSHKCELEVLISTFMPSFERVRAYLRVCAIVCLLWFCCVRFIFVHARAGAGVLGRGRGGGGGAGAGLGCWLERSFFLSFVCVRVCT